MKHSIISPDKVASCYFRTSVEPPYRKALLQITEWCNLSCVHCFVSAGKFGNSLTLVDIQNTIIPRLHQLRVISITLTGGEPFAHPQIVEIVQAFRSNGICVTICTNATLIQEEQLRQFQEMGDVYINVSLDGFSENSHGKFRGDKQSFQITKNTISLISRYKILKGILVTPNNLAKTNEYSELCKFAIANGAKYVLMNPLSYMGRGVYSQKALATSKAEMIRIKESTSPYASQIELVNIRFPNQDLPLSSCEAGNIVYIFVDGAVTVCPYLVFAARTQNSKHNPDEFLVGNILTDSDIALKLDGYKFHERYKLGDNALCSSCDLNANCGKGCPAAIIASGQRIEQVDMEVCPKVQTN